MDLGVLLVEDEEDLRTLVIETLSDRNYHVIGASDGADALAMYEQHSDSIRLVIVDLILPDMRGHELAMRLAHRDPTLRFLICSGYEPPAMSKDFEVAFLAKPFTVDELLETVADQMRFIGPSRISAGR